MSRQKAPRDLFTSAPAPTPGRGTDKWYFSTNQMNLMSILAAGLVMSPRGFGGKYYSDSLSAHPGWIPLFAAVPKEVVRGSHEEEKFLIPILV
ncbi:MAG: hypothetical protein ACRELB_00245, partial [Polyangiaceae bacterium]